MKQVILAVIGVIVGCQEVNWNGADTYQEMKNRSLRYGTKGDFKVVPATKISTNGALTFSNYGNRRQTKQNIVQQKPVALTATVLPVSQPVKVVSTVSAVAPTIVQSPSAVQVSTILNPTPYVSKPVSSNVVQGTQNVIAGTQNVLSGHKNYFQGDNNLAVGHQNHVSGSCNQVVGSQCLVQGNLNTVVSGKNVNFNQLI